MTRDGLWEVLPFDAGSFTFPPDEPWAGEEGVVVAHALRARDGSVFLFDTGIAAGHPELDARYHPVERPLDDALAALGLELLDVVAATNCHLHADHAGQNHRLTGVPIFVQRAEHEAAAGPDYTVDAWVNLPGLQYQVVDGDLEVLPGIRLLANPGHTAGHQSLVVETRESRSSARDPGAYMRSVGRLRDVSAVEVRFAHDRCTWQRS